MSFSSDWLKAIQLKPRFLFGIWLLGTLVLFLPENVAARFGIVEARIALQPWIGLGTLAAFSFWVIQLIPSLSDYWLKRKFKRQIIRALDFMSPEEWVLLAYCLKQNQQTVTLSLVDRAAGSLTARGILDRAGGVGNQLAWPYTIPTFLWKHLLKNRERFFAAAPFPSDEIDAHLLGLHQHIHRHHF
jgi:hypothetical protein